MPDSLLDLTAYEHFPANYPAAFVKFHRANGWVYDGIVAQAKALQEEGYSGVGMRYLYEHQRYTEEARKHREANPAIWFGLNNDFAAWYGRLVATQEPELREFFRLRQTKAELAATDRTQTAFEFD